MKIRICITGYDGFIGSNLLKSPVLRRKNVVLIPFRGDLLKKSDIEEFFKKNEKIDQIIHLAGVFFGDFKTLIDINLLATQNLLEVALKNKVKKIIFSSTGAVYGEPIRKESVEKDPLKPNTMYGLVKYYTEECIKYNADRFKFNYVILRFPNVYGENNNKGVIYDFKKNINDKAEITIYGDGKQARNFLHVKDACRSIVKSIFYNKSNIFNISNPVKISINDVVKILSAKYMFKIKYKEEKNNLKELLLNIDKAEKVLKFKPLVRELLI